MLRPTSPLQSYTHSSLIPANPESTAYVPQSLFHLVNISPSTLAGLDGTSKLVHVLIHGRWQCATSSVSHAALEFNLVRFPYASVGDRIGLGAFETHVD